MVNSFQEASAVSEITQRGDAYCSEELGMVGAGWWRQESEFGQQWFIWKESTLSGCKNWKLRLPVPPSGRDLYRKNDYTQ